MKKKVLAVANILNIQVNRRQDTYCAIVNTFRCQDLQLFHNSIRVVEENDTGDICIFSDVYHVDDTKLDEVAQRCTASGISTTAFVHNYPKLDFSEGYNPEKKVGIYNMGYSRFYRGCIAGLRFSG